MLSPTAHISPSFPTDFISPPPKWLDSDDELELEPALAMMLSLSSRRAVLVLPLLHLQIQKMPMSILYPLLFKKPSFRLPHRLGPLFQDTISHTYQTQCPLRRARMSPLHSLHAQPRLGSSRPPLVELSLQTEKLDPPHARPTRCLPIYTEPRLTKDVIPASAAPS
jgi:hypothetical protein